MQRSENKDQISHLGLQDHAEIRKQGSDLILGTAGSFRDQKIRIRAHTWLSDHAEIRKQEKDLEQTCRSCKAWICQEYEFKKKD